MTAIKQLIICVLQLLFLSCCPKRSDNSFGIAKYGFYHESIPIATLLFCEQKIWELEFISTAFPSPFQMFKLLSDSCLRWPSAQYWRQVEWGEPRSVRAWFNTRNAEKRTSVLHFAEQQSSNLQQNSTASDWNLGKWQLALKGIGTWSVHIVFSISRPALGLCGVIKICVSNINGYFFFFYLMTSTSDIIRRKPFVKESRFKIPVCICKLVCNKFSSGPNSVRISVKK